MARRRVDPGVGRGRDVVALHDRLRHYGYHAPGTDHFDCETEASVRAFQRHFRPDLCDGIFDPPTDDTLRRLTDLRDQG